MKPKLRHSIFYSLHQTVRKLFFDDLVRVLNVWELILWNVLLAELFGSVALSSATKDERFMSLYPFFHYRLSNTNAVSRTLLFISVGTHVRLCSFFDQHMNCWECFLALSWFSNAKLSKTWVLISWRVSFLLPYFSMMNRPRCETIKKVLSFMCTFSMLFHVPSSNVVVNKFRNKPDNSRADNKNPIDT